MLTFGTFSLGGGDIGAVHHEHFFFLYGEGNNKSHRLVVLL